MWSNPWNEDEREEDCGPHQQCQTKQSSIYFMVGIQCKLNNCQQNQSDAVDVDDDSNLLGVIESFDLHPACVEGHEHGHQLQESLVGIRDGQPHYCTTVNTSEYKVAKVGPCSLSNQQCTAIY